LLVKKVANLADYRLCPGIALLGHISTENSKSPRTTHLEARMHSNRTIRKFTNEGIGTKTKTPMHLGKASL